MNSFMNALWNATGSMVTGFYKEEPFIGEIVNVRTKAGTDLSVTVATEEGETFVFNGSELFNGAGTCSKNLHVYF